MKRLARHSQGVMDVACTLFVPLSLGLIKMETISSLMHSATNVKLGRREDRALL